jgi:hypothetical protein
MDPQLIQYYNKKLNGLRLPSEALPEVINSHKIVIVHFLRHLGCIYCKHAVDQLYKISTQNPGFPPIIFVHQSPLEVGETFFEKHFPGASHISDPELSLYNLFGIQSLNGLHYFDPRMILKGIKLTFQGYSNRLGMGNMRLLSGTFLFLNGKLVWQHRAKRAGEEPNWKKVIPK